MRKKMILFILNLISLLDRVSERSGGGTKKRVEIERKEIKKLR